MRKIREMKKVTTERMGQKTRQPNTLKRGTTPRLRAFIEDRLRAFPTRKDAADSLEISPTEVSFFAQGSRTPSAEQILKFLTIVPANGPKNLADTEFCGNLDQRLIDGGYTPLFFKHLVPVDQRVLVLRRSDDGYSIHHQMGLPPIFFDARFACRHAGHQIALLEDGEQPSYLLLEPIYDDSDLSNGDVALFAKVGKGPRIYFGRLSRHDDGAYLNVVEPPTMEDRGRPLEPSEEIDLRARVLLNFNSPTKSTGVPSRSIRGLDKMRIGVSPFQDALLVSIGAELGFYEEEGLLVQLEPVDWYEWPRFFQYKSDIGIVFSNIFSFVREYKELPSLRYLYGTNLFNQGFALLSKSLPGHGPGRNPSLEDILLVRESAGEDSSRIPIGTIAESDWAAQLFTLCEERHYNLAVSYGPFEEHIYPEKGRIPNKPTIVIIDSNRQTGVVNDPVVIDRTQEFYFGSMPQRFRLTRDFGWTTVNAEITPPFPVNGFVGGADLFAKNKDVLLRFLRVWFRIVNYIRQELDSKNSDAVVGAQAGSRLVQRVFDNGLFAPNTAKLKITTASSGQNVNEVVDAWRKECFPETPLEIERTILGVGQVSPWREDARRAIKYLGALFKKKERTLNQRWQNLQQQLETHGDVSGDCPFLLDRVHKEYIRQYGRGTIMRKELDGEPLPDGLA